MTTSFKHEHEALTAFLREYVAILRTEGVAAMPEIVRKRILLSQLLRDHMGREDMAALALRKGPMAQKAEPFVREHSRAAVAFFLHYTDHLKFWTTAQVTQDMPGYIDAVMALKQELDARMTWEERYLHPLIEQPVRKAA